MWIDQQLVRNVEDPIEKPLLGHFKLAYMSGKGTKYLVPVLISLDVISGINKLVELRDDVGVNSDNPYLFANTQGSLKPVSGWQCVNEVCVAAGVQDLTKLTATAMRHRASTLYALGGCECFLSRALLSGSHCVLSRCMSCCTSAANKDEDDDG